MLIKYYKNKGWKYQLAERVVWQSSIKPDENIIQLFYSIFTTGLIIAQPGYAWDGASGPCPDINSVMPGSLFHDIIWQALRRGELDQKWKAQGNKELRLICLSDGMWPRLAKLIYVAVSKGAGWAASPKRKLKLRVAGRDITITMEKKEGRDAQ